MCLINFFKRVILRLITLKRKIQMNRFHTFLTGIFPNNPLINLFPSNVNGQLSMISCVVMYPDYSCTFTVKVVGRELELNFSILKCPPQINGCPFPDSIFYLSDVSRTLNTNYQRISDHLISSHYNWVP